VNETKPKKIGVFNVENGWRSRILCQSFSQMTIDTPAGRIFHTGD